MAGPGDISSGHAGWYTRPDGSKYRVASGGGGGRRRRPARGEVIERDLGWDAILRELERAQHSSITVGIHDRGTEGGGLPVAQVGAFHEFGLGVPQRSWLASTLEEKADELADLADSLYWRGVLAGKITARTGLAIIGQKAQDFVRTKIRDSDPKWPPLAQSTKRKKARTIKGDKGRAEFLGGDGNPLIDTGQLLRSVRYKVTIVDNAMEVAA